jgi:hypothetical protein
VTFDNQSRVNASFQLYVVRDNDPYPASLEICNGIDDDCDGLVDENYSLLVTNEADSGLNTLRAILQCAQNGDTIRFAAAVDTIVLVSPLQFTKNLVLLDEIGQRVVLDIDLQLPGFASASAALQFSASSVTTLSQLAISHTGNSMTKPVVLNQGQLTLHQCTVTGNPASLLKNEMGASFTTSGVVVIE